MMDKLKEYLSTAVHEHRADVILDALECLQKHGYMSAWAELGTTLEYASDESTAMVVDAIEHILSVGQEQLLNAFSITMTDGIAMRTEVLNGILLLEAYDDGDAIRALCDNVIDPVDTFADLLEVVLTKSAMHIVEHLVSVSPALISKIAGLYKPTNDADDATAFPTPSADRLTYIRNYATQYPNAIARGLVIDESVRINTPMDILLQHQKLPLATFEPEAPQQAAIELVGLYLISDRGEKIVANDIKDYLDQLYSDMDFITAAGSAIDNILNGVRTNAHS